MNQEANRTWLIRYANNSYSRPMPESELKKLFSSGEMKPQDEICPGNGYWFSLQDVNEMKKHFGTMSFDGLFKKVKEEITQERYVDTAPLVVPQAVRQSMKPRPQVKEEVVHDGSIQKASPLMKILLVLVTVMVLALLFVWFG